MRSMPPAVARYLSRHAASGPWCVEGSEGGNFSRAVVIPALAETTSLPATLDSLATNSAELLAGTLILIVVNHRSDSAIEDKQDNLRTLKHLNAGSWQRSGLHLSWVDAASPGRELPDKDGGVGLARKIGFDLALQRLSYGQPESVLMALDADTLVGPNYLSVLQSHFQSALAGAAVVPFCHQPGKDPAHNNAILRYELFLRSHLLGLTLAGSPYAFHTIGSTMACRATAYARAGGMNRRRAGEDFYFLQQLAKTTGVASLQGTQVYPSARPSKRTPFGTGRSVTALLEEGSAAVLFYPASCYSLLGDWLTLVRSQPDLEGTTLLTRAGQLSTELADFLAGEKFPALWDRFRTTHGRPQARIKAFHDWFDGLKTVRLIHHLCAGSHPRCHPQAVLPILLKEANLASALCPEQQLGTLRRHQGGLS